MAELDIATVANVAEILGIVALAGALVFAIVQVREGRRQAREATALQFVLQIQSEEWARNAGVVRELPRDVPIEEIRRLGPDAEAAVYRVCAFYESVGILMHRGVLPVDIVFEVLIVRVHWEKLRQFVRARREELGNPRVSEWFEWLADRSAEYGRIERPAAAEAYADWLPPERRLRTAWRR